MDTRCKNVSIIDNGQAAHATAEISNRHGNARISLLGANIIEWVPKDADPVIWLSDEARFEVGKSIRGGVPICWPWFGAHASEPDYPAHGFARTRLWQLLDARNLPHGETRLTFTLPPDEEAQQMWPCVTELELHVTVGPALKLELVTCNLGSQPVTLTQALHTYFNVSDVSKVKVLGLEKQRYLDKLEGFIEKKQRGALSIKKEVDRIYLDTENECIIEDPGMKRRIHISKQGSRSTVVWNPWKATAEKMGDLGKDGYKQMLCVETSNAADDVITLEQGDQHRLIAKYDVQAM